jgi:transposase-like protein
VFAEKYQAKYPKAVECLIKDQDAPLTLLDFPAEHSHDRRQCFSRGRSAGGAHRA